jgi:hypothetical protein
MNKADQQSLSAAYDIVLRRSDGCSRTATALFSAALRAFAVTESAAAVASPRRFLDAVESNEV